MPATTAKTWNALDRLQARYDLTPVLVIPVAQGWAIVVRRNAYWFLADERCNGEKQFTVEAIDAAGDWHEHEGRNDQAKAEACARRMARWLARELRQG